MASFSLAEDEDDDMVVSGWGDVERPGMRVDLLKDWGEILERWDGKDRARPSRVIKLCRKVCEGGRGQEREGMEGKGRVVVVVGVVYARTFVPIQYIDLVNLWNF